MNRLLVLLATCLVLVSAVPVEDEIPGTGAKMPRMPDLPDLPEIPDQLPSLPTDSEMEAAEDSIQTLISASAAVHHEVAEKMRAATDSPTFSPFANGDHATPQTDTLCQRIATLYNHAKAQHDKLFYTVEPLMTKACTIVEAVVTGCNYVKWINGNATTGKTILTPAQYFPYIGPVIKVATKAITTVKASTDVGKKCTNFVDRLALVRLKDKCKANPGIMRHTRNMRLRLGKMFADLEVLQKLYCTCHNYTPEMLKFMLGYNVVTMTNNPVLLKNPGHSMDGDRACACLKGNSTSAWLNFNYDAHPSYGWYPWKTACDSSDVGIATCIDNSEDKMRCPYENPRWTSAVGGEVRGGPMNMHYLGRKYCLVNKAVECASGKMNAGIDLMISALMEPMNVINRMLDLANWVIKLEFLHDFLPDIGAFFNILNPFNQFIELVRGFLSAEITIKFPGCEEEEQALLQEKMGKGPGLGGRKKMSQMTKAELSVMLQKKIGMTYDEAMTPVKDYVHHPKVVAMRKKFADNVQYKPIDSLDLGSVFLQTGAKSESAGGVAATIKAKPAAKESNEGGHTAGSLLLQHGQTAKVGSCNDVCPPGKCDLAVDATKPECKECADCHKQADKPVQSRRRLLAAVTKQISQDTGDVGKDLASNMDGATFDAQVDEKSRAGAKVKWGGRRRRWHVHHHHHPHWHVPHSHHFHIPHRHHIHIPHSHHIHIPHRHHFHAAAIVQSIGHGIVSAVQAIGDLICYEVKFSVMDILNGIGTLLSWMMAPVEWAINALLSGIGISLPSLPGMPAWLDFPTIDLFFNWDIDWFGFNWDLLKVDFEIVSLMVDLPELPDWLEVPNVCDSPKLNELTAALGC